MQLLELPFKNKISNITKGSIDNYGINTSKLVN